MEIALYIFSGACASLFVLMWFFAAFMLVQAVWLVLSARIAQRCNRNGTKNTKPIAR